jgi:ribosomal protein S18 acetylase RimI-like enzyme
MEIRPMKKSDHEEVSRLLCACYRLLGRLEHLPPKTVEFLLAERGSVASLEREAASQIFLVAESEGAIVGMVAIDGNQVAKLYVDPACHGRRIGAALFRTAERSIIQRGYTDLTLGAAPSAVGFYRSMGLSVTGHKCPAGGPLAGHHTILMRKQLDAI